MFVALIGQTNPNWLLFAFQTDPNPFHARLQQILASFNDARLLAYPLDAKYLPKFTKEDAGYTATDEVLKNIMSSHSECKWISVTNGDNVYGSNIVELVLSQSTDGEKSVSMLLAPIDSRNFAEQGKIDLLIVYSMLDIVSRIHV